MAHGGDEFVLEALAFPAFADVRDRAKNEPLRLDRIKINFDGNFRSVLTQADGPAALAEAGSVAMMEKSVRQQP